MNLLYSINLSYIYVYSFLICKSLPACALDLTYYGLTAALNKINRDIYIILPSKNSVTNNTSSTGIPVHLPTFLEEITQASVDLLPLSSFSMMFPPPLESTTCDELLEEERLDVLRGRKNTRGKLFLVMLQSQTDIKAFLDLIEGTAIQPGMCDLDIRTGVLDRENVFLFYFTSPESDYSFGKDVILKRRLLVKHRYVGLLKTTQSGQFVLARHDMYSNKTSLKRPESVETLQDLFPAFPMDGFEFTVAGIPYDAYVTGDSNPDALDETRAYDNYSGLEVEMVHIVSKVLGYRYDFVNSADQQWGAIVDGKWNGMVKMVMDFEADFMISAVGRFLFRRKVLINTIGFIKDRLIFLTSKPKRSHNLLTIVRPLQANVWLLVLLSSIAITFSIWSVSRKEEHLVQKDLSTWSHWRQAIWYVFGTLIGESITRGTKSEGAWGLRTLLCVWILFAFLLTAGYGGQLRSFLLHPEFEDPIDTLDKVLHSGIPWEMGLYGEDVEVEMARSEHPTMKAIWDGKIPVISEAFAFQRMQKIVDGESILIDWMNKLQTSMYIGFTLSNGETLMEYYNLPIVHSHVECVWGFNPFNPHVERFDDVIIKLVEAGLIDKIHYRTRLRLKRQYGSGEAILKKEEHFMALTTTDLLGSILFYFSFAIMSLVVFIAEITFWNLTQPSRREKERITLPQ